MSFADVLCMWVGRVVCALGGITVIFILSGLLANQILKKCYALSKPAVDNDGKPFVVIRSYGAGVFAGYLAERDDANQMVKLNGCIRLWRWTGATISQVSLDGIAGTRKNKFSLPTDGHVILQVIEILKCTEKARIAIQGVKPWKV